MQHALYILLAALLLVIVIAIAHRLLSSPVLDLEPDDHDEADADDDIFT